MDDWSTNDTLKLPINIFNGVLDNDCSHVVTIKAVLKGIKEGKWKDEIEWYRQETDKEERETIKKRFPGVTFSGVFKDRRLDKNIVQYNNILVIDIDKKDVNMPMKKVKEIICGLPFVFCAFESPSGGIKALTMSELPVEDHKVFFRGVEENLMDNYGIKIDASGKNPGRLCFISYDPQIYIDFDNKILFDLELHAPKTHITELSRDYEEVSNMDMSKYENVYDIDHIFDVAKKMAIKGVGHYRKGNRNNYIFHLSCIFNRAGIQNEDAINIIFGTYRSLGFDEVKRTVNSAYRHNKNEFGSRPITKRKKYNQNKIV